MSDLGLNNAANSELKKDELSDPPFLLCRKIIDNTTRRHLTSTQRNLQRLVSSGHVIIAEPDCGSEAPSLSPIVNVGPSTIKAKGPDI
jgi:hypothetical protein